MKSCRQCGRSYNDDTLNFCLEDGTPLAAVMPAAPNQSEPPTALMSSIPYVGDAPTIVSDPGAAAYPSVSKPTNSIAVLPFAHRSDDSDDEYFCDGLAEELINALARIDGLRVVARTSSFSFKGKNVEVSSIGSILNVQHIVEGSVRRFGDRMRINVQLVNASDGYHIWSEKFDRGIGDLFDVQDEITRQVVKSLKAKLLGPPRDSGEMNELLEELKHHARDVEIYQLYLKGRYYLNSFTPDGFYRAIDCFEQTIETDPNFASGYAGLADAYILLTEFGPVTAFEGMPKAKAAALKAIAFDPSLSEAHASLALVLQDFDFDFEGAEREYRVAIELNSNNAMAFQYYGALLGQLGRFGEAEENCRKAHDLDPLSAIGNWVYPFVLFFQKNYREAIERARAVLELEPNFPAAFLVQSFAYQMLGDHAAAVNAYIRFIELCGLPEIASKGRSAFEDNGWDGFLRSMVDNDSLSVLSSYIVAVYYAALEQYDDALATLEESLRRREGYVVMLKVDPRFDMLRSNAQFTSILDRIGFPDQ